MAQKFECDDSIDNNNDITPSLQRVRNILTLKERVAVIEAYDRRPIFTEVARMFNCSWEQIKNIVANREVVMEFYNATRSGIFEELELKDDTESSLREKKIKFLGECVYESIKRLHYYAKKPVTEELIRLKAFEFQDILKISEFTPNNNWLNMFVINYNISLSKKQIAIPTAPPSCMDLQNIVIYCTKREAFKPNNSLQSRYNQFDTNSEKYENERLRKIDLLQKALSEYMLRVRIHHKSIQLTGKMLHKIATEFCEILKLQDFEPTLEWVHKQKQINMGLPHLCLDLKDILSYCIRMHNKEKASTITLAPKETALEMPIISKFPGNSEEVVIVDSDSDNENEKDIQPDIEEIKIEQSQLQEPPPLKIRKIESKQNDTELQRHLSHTELQESYIIVADDFKEQAIHIKAPINTADVQTKEEIAQKVEFILPTTTPHATTAPTIVKQENTTTNVTSFKDILSLLKPLEEHAMLKENYRAIGLITQLEEVFKNQPEAHNTLKEEE